jgi:hypothetical protein
MQQSADLHELRYTIQIKPQIIGIENKQPLATILMISSPLSSGLLDLGLHHHMLYNRRFSPRKTTGDSPSHQSKQENYKVVITNLFMSLVQYIGQRKDKDVLWYGKYI